MSEDNMAVCLWFDGVAEEAARFYCEVFPDSRVESVNHGPMDWPGGSAGEVLTVEFTLRGNAMVALNGGPGEAFTNATSVQVYTETQSETDRYWSALLPGGAPMACSWLVDRYGVRWQIVPRVLMDGLRHRDEAVSRRVNEAMMQMVKIDHAAIEAAIAG